MNPTKPNNRYSRKKTTSPYCADFALIYLDRYSSLLMIHCKCQRRLNRPYLIVSLRAEALGTSRESAKTLYRLAGVLSDFEATLSRRSTLQLNRKLRFLGVMALFLRT